VSSSPPKRPALEESDDEETQVYCGTPNSYAAVDKSPAPKRVTPPAKDAEIDDDDATSSDDDNDGDADYSDSAIVLEYQPSTARHPLLVARNGNKSTDMVTCAHTTCKQLVPINLASMCDALYRRTHWKSYLCNVHRILFDNPSEVRCFGCGVSEFFSQVEPLTRITRLCKTFEFKFLFCKECVTQPHVVRQLEDVSAWESLVDALKAKK